MSFHYQVKSQKCGAWATFEGAVPIPRPQPRTAPPVEHQILPVAKLGLSQLTEHKTKQRIVADMLLYTLSTSQCYLSFFSFFVVVPMCTIFML